MQITFPVASTILDQLGGNKFRVMTGAKNFLATDTALSFNLPIGKYKVCRILLTPMDVYRVEFYRSAKATRSGVPHEQIDNVYCDQLRAVFELHTGLRTSLTGIAS